MPCGIDDSNLEAIRLVRADGASLYGQGSAVSDSDKDHETARAAKRVDCGGEVSGEDKDEVFSDGDFPVNTET